LSWWAAFQEKAFLEKAFLEEAFLEEAFQEKASQRQFKAGIDRTSDFELCF
jgi:hypothetical protein